MEAIFRKGIDPEIDSYSSFYDNHHEKTTGLAGYLKEKGVEELHFCGLAADVCVHFSILDALKEGFEVILIEDATRALDGEDYREAKKEWKERGVKMVQSEEIID